MAEEVFGVLTGDIVSSSSLASGDLRKVLGRLRDGTKRFAEAFPGSVYGELDVFSGDGWQVLMTDWERSLRAALFLRATGSSASIRGSPLRGGR